MQEVDKKIKLLTPYHSHSEPSEESAYQLPRRDASLTLSMTGAAPTSICGTPCSFRLLDGILQR